MTKKKAIDLNCVITVLKGILATLYNKAANNKKNTRNGTDETINRVVPHTARNNNLMPGFSL
ncbi:hypothetical protein HNQ74_001087 [Bartonella doshiae]|nr:hypothetical protein [Bartonella doshiae]